MTALKLAVAGLWLAVSVGFAQAGQQVDKPAADFSLPDAAHKPVKLGELRGKSRGVERRGADGDKFGGHECEQ